MPVAVAYKHFKLGHAVAYFHLICSMAELARVKGELEIKVIVYDECWRKASRPRTLGSGGYSAKRGMHWHKIKRNTLMLSVSSVRCTQW